MECSFHCGSMIGDGKEVIGVVFDFVQYMGAGALSHKGTLLVHELLDVWLRLGTLGGGGVETLKPLTEAPIGMECTLNRKFSFMFRLVECDHDPPHPLLKICEVVVASTTTGGG